MSSAVNGMRLAREDAGDDLAEAAEAGDDHMPVVVGRRIVRRAPAPSGARQQALEHEQDGVAAIDSVTTTASSSAVSRGSEPAA